MIQVTGAKNSGEMQNVSSHMSELNLLNQKIIDAMGNINESVEKYNVMTQDVENIARKINLLSLNAAIDKFDSTVGELLTAVAQAIADAKKTSENSGHIQNSMEKVSQIADKVQGVIHETNRILN